MKVLHSICQQIWKTQQWPQDWKRSVFTPIPMEGNAKGSSTTVQLHSSHMLVKGMLKILQASLQQHVIHELPGVHTGFRKGRGTRDQIASICWITEKAREIPRKISTSVSSTMLKPLTVWIITNCGKLLKRWEYQTILLVSWETCMWVKKQS